LPLHKDLRLEPGQLQVRLMVFDRLKLFSDWRIGQLLLHYLHKEVEVAHEKDGQLTDR
jgi:hypothetical protein